MAASSPRSDPFALVGATLFDGTGRPPVEDTCVVVADGRIAAVGRGVPAGMRVENVSGLGLLPGLIDLHVHFGASTRETHRQTLEEARRDYAALRPGVRSALLDAGVTTIRSVGDLKDAILTLKQQVAVGALEGPRVFCAGPVFTAPGGHPVGTVYRGNGWLAAHGAREVTDPGVARDEVHRLVADGVDGIKAVYSSGRVPRLSTEVLHALGAAARSAGVWFAVHTGSLLEVREAAQAGATSVEHGVTSGEPLDPETIALLRASDVAYVPTLGVAHAVWRTTEPDRVARLLANTRSAHEAAVRIGVGTDAQGPAMSFRDGVADELRLLVEAGLSPVEALVAATSENARLLGVGADLGTIEPGKRADLVLVNGRPWQRIGDVRHIHAVVQGGQLRRVAPAGP